MSSQRGKHPQYDQWFSQAWHPVFREAVEDHCFLLSRGYVTNAALELVGNRYHLNQRQRMAVRRMGASSKEIANRKRRQCNTIELVHQGIDIEAINLLADTFQELQVLSVRWLLDAPISHSDTLKTFLQKVSKTNGYCWEAAVVNNPDQELVKSTRIVISSDGWILSQVSKWYNLGAYLIEHKMKAANVITA